MGRMESDKEVEGDKMAMNGSGEKFLRYVILPEASGAVMANEVALREMGREVERLKTIVFALCGSVYDLKMCGDISPTLFEEILPYVSREERKGVRK